MIDWRKEKRGIFGFEEKKYCLPFSKRKKKKKQRIWPAFPVNNKCCPYSNHQPLQHPMVEQPEGNLDGEIKDTGATSCGKMGLSTWIPQTRPMEEIISGEYEQHPGRRWAKKWHIDQKAEKLKTPGKESSWGHVGGRHGQKIYLSSVVLLKDKMEKSA